MMLVVPLSSCIADDSFPQQSSVLNSGTDPEEPKAPDVPGKYTIKYSDPNNPSNILNKEYDGTFAYAAPLPSGWTAPGDKVFAGWSKINPNSGDSPSTIGEEVSSPDVYYQVYDDIKLEDVAEGNLQLYAVWTDKASGGKLNTVYLSKNGSVSGIDSTQLVSKFNDAYGRLDPDGTTTTNRIVIVGEYEVDVSNYRELTLWNTSDKKSIKATICGMNDDSILSVKGLDGGIILKADTVFENIKFKNNSSQRNQIFIYCYGHNLTMGERIVTSGVTSLSPGLKGNESYAIPAGYPAFTILGGEHGGKLDDSTIREPTDVLDIGALNTSDDTDNNEVEIKLISGTYGRVSGFGRSYEPGKGEFYTKHIESLCPTIIVCGDADVGTLAAGHLDSNCITGFKDSELKNANLIVRDSAVVVNLVGGNIGNNAQSTFIGNVIISIFGGTVNNIYGAGLGRVGETKLSNLPQTSMSGIVSVYLCGGTIKGSVYGGGAASALSSAYAANISESLDNITSGTRIIISSGNIKENVYGGGYGNSEYMKDNHYSYGENNVSAGTIGGTTYVAVLGGIIGTSGDQASGNIYGGGKGATHTGDSASVAGDTAVMIFGGIINGSIYGGGEGLLGKEGVAKVGGSTSVYVSNGEIKGNVYGGGSIAVVSEATRVTINGGIVGSVSSPGRVFGGGEGTASLGVDDCETYSVSEWINKVKETNWPGQVIGTTNVSIYKGVIYGSVYGGGNFAYVGNVSVPGYDAPSGSSSTCVVIGPVCETVNDEDIRIAGSVYGGGRGDESDTSKPNPTDNNIIYNAVVKGNVYGDTSVNISGGMIGSIANDSESSPNGWSASEGAGSVYGGGKLGLVTGDTKVSITGGEIHRSVYGGGKGLSKSVFIGYPLSGDNTAHSKIEAYLYNMYDKREFPKISDVLGSNISTVSEYVWQSSSDINGDFTDIVSQHHTAPEILSSATADKYLRLKVTIENDIIGNETYYSNIIDKNEINPTNLAEAEKLWETKNRMMVQFGIVSGTADVNISGSANIHTNVYGGGSYAAIGTITATTNSPEDDYRFTHKITDGSTAVTISGGNIGLTNLGTYSIHTSAGGNVFGGGMGEAYLVTAGSVGTSTTLNISGGNIRGNIYGGGENGFVGSVEIEISEGMSEIPTVGVSETMLAPSHTWNYSLTLLESADFDNAGNTNIRITGGTIGVTSADFTQSDDSEYKPDEHGNIFGGGMGSNATVTESTNVNICPNQTVTKGICIYGSVYGGGELGIVGYITGQGTGATIKITGGSALVNIAGSESCAITIAGDVFGAGKGRYTTEPDDAVLGAVGEKTTVKITSDSKDFLKIKGSVYGGGELSIVGTYADTSGDGTTKYTFTGGETIVSISGGTIYENVYGGGKGNPYNIVSGAVGKTNVIIDGITIVNTTTITSKQTQIGYKDTPIPSSNAYMKVINATVEQSSDKINSDSLIPDGHNVLVSVLQPEHGEITVGTDTLPMIASEKQSHTDGKTYDVYRVAPGTAIHLTYASKDGHYVSTWYNVSDDESCTPTTATFVVGSNANEKITVWVDDSSDLYYYTIIKPTQGTINIYSDNKILEPLPPNPSSVEQHYSIYEVKYGTELKLIYTSEDPSVFVKKWVTNPTRNVLYAEDDSDAAFIIVRGDTTISVLEGPSIGNVYGGGAYGFVGYNVMATLNPNAEEKTKISSVDDAAYTNVIIRGGKIGADDIGSVSTGNVFGGGYGPGAFIAGSTHVYIGNNSTTNDLAKNLETIQNLLQTTTNNVGIHGNVYGGGEMGPIGLKDAPSTNFSSNVTISSSSESTVIIGHTGFKPDDLNDPSKLSALHSDILGNVFGGGEGGDIPNSVLANASDDSNSPSTQMGISNGYATIYGPTKVIIFGEYSNSRNELGNLDSNITIRGGVYGGGEGIIKGYNIENKTTFDMDPNNTNRNVGIFDSILYGQVTGDNDGNAATHIFIDDAVVMKTVFGGGKLGIVGSYEKSGQFSGKDTFVFISGFIRSNVYGGGEGHTESAIAGSVGSTLVVIDGNAEIGSRNEIYAMEGPLGLTLTAGNVYGGGRLSITGSFTLDRGNPLEIIPSVKVGGKSIDNQAESRVIILGGTIYNSIYGGGFSPKASIAGSAYVYIGDNYVSKIVNKLENGSNEEGDLCKGSAYQFLSSLKDDLLAEDITICKDVYGGGEMGSIGTSVLEICDTQGQLDKNQSNSSIYLHSIIDAANGYDYNYWVSANVYMNSDTKNIKVGWMYEKAMNWNDGKAGSGDIYGGGKGVLNSEVHGILGYAVVRGNTQVLLKGSEKPSEYPNSTVLINGSVYGGGKGIRHDVESIHYAEVYDFTDVQISNVTVNGNIYGGAELGIVGHFYDDHPKLNTENPNADSNFITLTIYKSYVKGRLSYPTKDDGTNDTESGKYNIDGLYDVNTNDEITVYNCSQYFDGRITTSEQFNSLKNGLKNISILNREYCSDNISMSDESYVKGQLAYNGKGTTSVNIYNSNINGNVYGGGMGVETNILAGAVGRGTLVTIDGCKTHVTGNVYGGGELGIIGSVLNQVIGTGAFAPVKVVNVVHAKLDKMDTNDLDLMNDIDIMVNIKDGQFDGSIFGAGKGEECHYEGVPTNSDTAISFYKLSVFGRTEVNVSGGTINKHVYGGSENGETGSLTILKNIHNFTSDYWASYNYEHPEEGGYKNGAPGDIPEGARDNGFVEYGAGGTPVKNEDGSDKVVKADLRKFSASLVNVAGGTIHGSVFGGGYFGAIHGNTHVHIGWNSVMPYENSDGSKSKGDCHYYNDYKNVEGNPDGNYGGRELPFTARDIFGDPVQGGLNGVGNEGHLNDALLTRENTVHDLFLNGTVYAGGDRGDPGKKNLDYNYISVYGTSHIFINGTGYRNTGTNEDTNSQYAMHIQGSLFGSGNSCTTFYSEKPNSRFITIKNYDAVDSEKLNKYIIYSIQRATEVTLINSSLKLPGRSDGSNIDATALYSLNHINKLTLTDGSTLSLDTVVHDLRGIYSKLSIDSDEDAQLNDTLNIIQLNNGITLIVAKVIENSDDGTQTQSSESQGLEFGDVHGYFILNLGDSKYYSGYVYGEYQQTGTATGGFRYGTSFTSGLPGTEINRIDLNDQYSYWHAGGGHSSSTVALITGGDGKTAADAPSVDGFNVVKGVAQLPLTNVGTRYNFIGMNIYPAQANSLSKYDSKSLRLLNNADNTLKWDSTKNKNVDFGLYMNVGNGFASSDSQSQGLWISPDTDLAGKITNSGTQRGSSLPEMNFYLYYRNEIDKTGFAGSVEILIQEVTVDENKSEDDPDYITEYGNEVRIIVDIQTQEVKEKGRYSTEQSIVLYPSRTKGFYKWNLSIPPIGSENNYQKYDIYIDDITSNRISLTSGVPSGNSEFKILMAPRDGLDYSEGWDGKTEEHTLLANESLNGGKFIGRTDGRWPSVIDFTIFNDKNVSGDYAIGTVTINARAVNPDNPGESYPLTLTVNTDNAIPNYRIIFNSNGGSSVLDQQKDEGAYVTEPNAPVKFDDNGHKYTFLGWYTDEACENEYIFINGQSQTPVSSNLRLYAKWGYTVTFHSNCPNTGLYKETYVEVGVNANGQITASDIPDFKSQNLYPGYEFSGWYNSPDGDDPWDTKSEISENTNVYAKWTTLQYTLSYDLKGASGSINPESGLSVGSEVPLSDGTGVSKPGYYLSGWEYDNTFCRLGSTFSMPAKNVTLNAVWVESNKYNVVINSNVSNAHFTYKLGEEPPKTAVNEASISVDAETVITIAFNYGTGALSGFTPADNPWIVTPGTISSSSDTSANGVLSAAFTINGISGDNKTVTITANFVGSVYDVTFDANGGTFADDTTSSVPQTVGKNYEFPETAPTKPSADFLGWFTSKTGGEVITSTDIVPYVPGDKPVTLYAHWNEYEYLLVFNPGGASSYNESYNIPIKFNDEVPLTNSFSYSGHVFDYWSYVDSDGSVEKYDDERFTLNNSTIGMFDTEHKLTFTANWKDEDFSVAINPESGIYNSATAYWDKDGPCNLSITITKSDSNKVTIDYTNYPTYESQYSFAWVNEKSKEAVTEVKNAGTYILTVTKLDSGAKGSAEFTITPMPLKDNMIEFDQDETEYYGQSSQPTITIKDSHGTKLTGIDYKVDSFEYVTNESGNVTVTISVTGEGNYSDTVTKTNTLSLRTYTINVIVKDDAGAELPGVKVSLVNDDGSALNVEHTASGGTYYFDGIKYNEAAKVIAKLTGYEATSNSIPIQFERAVESSGKHVITINVTLTKIPYNLSYNLNGGTGKIPEQNPIKIDEKIPTPSLEIISLKQDANL